MRSSALIAIALSGVAVVSYVSYRTLAPAPEAVPAAETQPAPAEPTAGAATPSPEAVETLPEFTLRTLEGEPRSIHDWPGRPLIINFWATWCAPCLREIPLLKEFQDMREAGGVQVVGIAVDRLDPVVSFAEKMQFNYPVLVGQADAMEAAAAFGVDFFALPFTVFTDAVGNILGVHTGELHGEDLDNLAAVLDALGAGAIDLEEARARVAGRI